MPKKKIIRTSTIALSLNVLLKGQLSFLNNHYNVVAVSGNDEDLKEVEKREQVHVHAIEMQRQISPLKDLISLIKLYLYFKKEQPQIVHSITPKAGLLSMIAAKYAGVPVRMHTFTGLIFPSKRGLLQRILIFMDKILCCHATNIYPEGQGVKNDLLSYKITTKPLKIIANGNVNGIDVDYFNVNQVSMEQQNQLKNELGILTDDFVFIFVGRLVGDKGINELIEAFKQVSKQFSTSKLLLVGLFEEKLDPLHSETLNEISQNKNIISVGFQKDVRFYFSIANALVFPSYREGFPNVVMQAGAMSLPSIVTNINGCNEIIIENYNGLVIPVKNTIAIFDAMRKMVEDVDFYNDLKQNSRKRIVDNYEQNVVWKAILDEYKSLEKYV
ncbi:glycosyltransferase family 4 protein [Flavobacterium sp.]|uniref:glycosyltransferase family 4 protein n=1 Tax=Flavobacterium sp. TaxID=239 RepID=UPI003F69C352